jgi:predicted Na+-dependent transporter
MGAAALRTRVLHPATFTGIGPWVATLLMLIMFGMGVHLKIDDFKRVLSRPRPSLRDLPALPGDAARGVAAGDGL